MVQALRVLKRAARAEKGFMAGWLDVETDDANAIRYEERWQTREDSEEQICSTRSTRLLDLLESVSERPLLEFHLVSETRGMEYVAAVHGEG